MVASCFFTGHRALCRAKQWPGLSQLENDVKHNTWKQKLAVTLPSSPGSISALSASFCLRNTADLPRGAKPAPSACHTSSSHHNLRIPVRICAQPPSLQSPYGRFCSDHWLITSPWLSCRLFLSSQRRLCKPQQENVPVLMENQKWLPVQHPSKIGSPWGPVGAQLPQLPPACLVHRLAILPTLRLPVIAADCLGLPKQRGCLDSGPLSQPSLPGKVICSSYEHSVSVHHSFSREQPCRSSNDESESLRKLEQRAPHATYIIV